MSEVLVPVGGLLDALRAVKPGDVLKLAPGEHTGFTTKYAPWKAADTPVVITSADTTDRAVLTAMDVRYVEGLVFRDVDFATKTIDRNYFAFQFFNCKTLSFEGLRVHGSPDGDASNDANGLSIRNSEDIKVIGSEFYELGRGLAIGSSKRILAHGNFAHDLRSDGFDFAEVTWCEITENHIRNIRRYGNDHPDGIQFWTSGTKTPSTDILIARNLLERGEGGGFQGIFLRDQLGTLPYERVRIEDNLLLCTGWSAIRVIGGKSIEACRNVLVTFDKAGEVVPSELVTYALFQKVDQLLAQDNSADRISFDRCTDVTDLNNTITKPVDDEGAAAREAWTKRLWPPVMDWQARAMAAEAKLAQIANIANN